MFTFAKPYSERKTNYTKENFKCRVHINCCQVAQKLSSCPQLSALPLSCLPLSLPTPSLPATRLPEAFPRAPLPG